MTASRDRVAIVYLGRPAARGEARRVQSWCDIVHAAGAIPLPIRLLELGRPRVVDMLDSIHGAAVHSGAPETIAWSTRRLRRAIETVDAGAVIFVTTRAYDSQLAEDIGTVVLDFVDRLSVSYRDRAKIVDGWLSSAGFSLLSTLHARVERGIVRPATSVAAGWRDAASLSVDWVPITIGQVPTPSSRTPDVDLLFVGNLSYSPNVDALDNLASSWSAIARLRPETTMLIAGTAPTRHVRDLAAKLGWDLVVDFDDAGEIYSRTRLAVAPLRHTAGMQIKLVDAATFGVPIIASSEAMAGLDPDFPATIGDGSGLATSIVDLLEDEGRCVEQASAALAHVMDRYHPTTWAPWLRRVLDRR